MKTLNDIDHLSASSIESFYKCPRGWAAHYLEGIPDTSPKLYADIGTVCHEVCERFITEGTDPLSHPTFKLIPIKERQKLLDYVQLLNELKVRPMQTELKFYVDITGGAAPPILGYIDIYTTTADDAILIIDHKSSRMPESSEDWQQKIQQRLYPAAVRKMIGNPFQRIITRIGYINLGYFVEWESLPSEDIGISNEVRNMWEQVTAMEALSSLQGDSYSGYPETVHQYCASCPRHEMCGEFEKHFTTFAASSAAKLLPEEPIDRWERLKAMAKVIAALIDETEEQVREKITSNKGEYSHGDKVFTLEFGLTRKVEFWPFWQILTTVADEYDPELMDKLQNMSSDLFTVKVGGIDKLLAVVPELREFIKDTIVKVPSETSSIKGKKKK